MAELATHEAEADRPGASYPAASNAEARTAAQATLRRRMKRQAMLMALVALLMLLTALSVPFVLRYLEITIP